MVSLIMLNLQTFLQDHTPEQVTEKYAVVTRRHETYPNLVLFKYSMIDSPLEDPLVQECRGIILDEANDWAVVSYPYNKFFNHGEDKAHPIDWDTAKVFEKVDGSLMTLYFWDGEWRVASSGSPDAGGEVYGTNLFFKGLFWKVWNDLGYELPSDNEQGMCFMFELCSNYNKIVVQHPKPRLVFHGARKLDTFQEMKPEGIAHAHQWEVVNSYPLQTLDEILATCDAIKPHEGEGYVICDANFNRIKVKTPQYVAISHLRDGMGSRRMLEIVRVGEGEEVLAYFPEFMSMHDEIKERYDAYVQTIHDEWDKVKDMPVGVLDEDYRILQKDFAMKVKDVPCKGILFSLRGKKYAGIREALLEMNVKHLMDILKVKDIVIEM
jgi:hypothetical protein